MLYLGFEIDFTHFTHNDFITLAIGDYSNSICK